MTGAVYTAPAADGVIAQTPATTGLYTANNSGHRSRLGPLHFVAWFATICCFFLYILLFGSLHFVQGLSWAWFSRFCSRLGSGLVLLYIFLLGPLHFVAWFSIYWCLVLYILFKAWLGLGSLHFVA